MQLQEGHTSNISQDLSIERVEDGYELAYWRENAGEYSVVYLSDEDALGLIQFLQRDYGERHFGALQDTASQERVIMSGPTSVTTYNDDLS